MLEALYPAMRTVLFTIDAERAHHFSMAGLRTAEKTGLLKLMGAPAIEKPVTFAGLTFPNAVGLAAGLDKEANTIDALGCLGFGHLEVGTLTPRPQPGNAQPRLFRLPEHQALINRMGFNNPGIEEGVENIRRSTRFSGILGVNIGKNKVTPNEDALSDYRAAFRIAAPVADYITANFSSPNTPGLRDLQSKESAAGLLGALKEEQADYQKKSGRYLPFALKVAPDLDDSQITDLADVFRDGGLDFLVATNTTIERSKIRGHRHAKEAGGLSGKPVANSSTEVIKKFHQQLGEDVPIIGAGGIFSAEDALEKKKAGAKLVQLYTGFIYRGPALIREINEAW